MFLQHWLYALTERIGPGLKGLEQLLLGGLRLGYVPEVQLTEPSSWQKRSKACRPALYSASCFQAVILYCDLFQTSGFHSLFQISSSALSGERFHVYGCLCSTSMLFHRWDCGHTKICYTESTQRLGFSLRMQLVFLTFQSKSICTQKYIS